MRCLSGNHNHNHLDNRLLPAVATPDMWSVNPPSLIHDQGSKQGPSGDQSGTVAPGRQIQWSWPWGLASYSLFVTVSLVRFGEDFSPCKRENRTQPFRGSLFCWSQVSFLWFQEAVHLSESEPTLFPKSVKQWPSGGERSGLVWLGWDSRWGNMGWETCPPLFFSFFFFFFSYIPTWVKMSWIGQMR